MSTMDKVNFASTYVYAGVSTALTYAKNKAKAQIKAFKEDERGVDGLVVAILLILVVVILAAIFWDQISGLFVRIWNSINEQTGDDTYNKDDVVSQITTAAGAGGE